MNQYFSPKMLSYNAFNEEKHTHVKIYAYANIAINRILAIQERSDTGFGLFSPAGVLMKLYGSPAFLKWCDTRSIMTGVSWTRHAFGETAVSKGLERLELCESRGEANENTLLNDVGITFYPLIVQDNTTHEKAFIRYGGLAAFYPADAPLTESKMIVSSLASDIMLHLYMGDSLLNIFYPDQRAFFNIDINGKTGVSHILYHNSQVFKILGLPKQMLYFKKAETIFDPLPENETFWDIIRKQTNVTDLTLQLCVRGRKATYIVSTEPYQQSHLGFAGIRFFISLPQTVSSHVAKQIGNNAIIHFDDIIGDCPPIRRCIQQAKAIAASESNVMIVGESGTGKDVFSQAIHNASSRCNNPFIALNCGAFPRDLLTSELFGYDEGAFTGAKKGGNIGKFELADTGTIFLDEIGNMPLDLQAIFLRIIEEKAFARIGSKVTRNVDVKIISATNADLKDMVEKGTFRADLYYRLCTLNLKLPPLRERGQDVILLANHFINVISSRLQLMQRKYLTEGARQYMLALPWYGNVRELQNVMERIVQLMPHDAITAEDVRSCLDFQPLPAYQAPPAPGWGYVPPSGTSFAPAAVPVQPVKKDEITREMIIQALEACHYKKVSAAKALGIARSTFYRKLEEYGIDC